MDIHCPACAAPIDESLRFEDQITCPFCGTASVIESSRRALGKDDRASATLTGVYTRFGVHRTGSIRWNNDVHEYRIHGRVQVEYDGGFWSEWYLDVNGQGYWLQEDEGTYILYMPVAVGEGPATSALAARLKDPGSPWKAGMVIESLGPGIPHWRLMECGTAKVVATEGTLPEPVKLNTAFLYADGVGDGVLYSLEMNMDGSGPEMTTGWPLAYESIRTDEETGFAASPDIQEGA